MSLKTFEELMAEGDNIGALCRLVEQVGGRMTLYGKPVDAHGLREHANGLAEKKLARYRR